MKKIIKKKEKAEKTVYTVLGIPVLKRVLKNGRKKCYFCGILYHTKKINTTHITSNPELQEELVFLRNRVNELEKQLADTEKFFMRLDSIKILQSRKNIKFGDRI